MNPEKTLLLVGGLDETLVKAKELGLDVLLLQHPGKVTEEQETYADVRHVLDYTDWSLTRPLVEQLYETYGFTAAVSLTEPGLEIAGRINDLFDLGGTGYDVAHRIRDKWTMRQHLARYDPAAVGAALLVTREDLDSFGTRYGFPFIVKPTDATASIGVFRVDGPADLDRVWSRVAELRGTRTDRISDMYVLEDFLMEEYVYGPEFSVESFSFAGRHVVVTITEKFSGEGHFAELGHAVPARLDEETWDSIRESVAVFLDRMGFRDGVCHTEVKVDPRGPTVIEGHNRFGGDAIPDLVRAAYGVDLTTLAVGWPFGLVDELPDRPRAHAGACARFIVGEPGSVLSIDGVQRATEQPGVLAVRITAKVGDPVHALRDNWDRLGLVAVTAADTDAAVQRAADVIRDTVDIRIAGDGGQIHVARVAEVADRVTAAVGRS
ncbi:ATP-grasp domain-containing protein [Dactylosporangium sp. CA-092794]|uniref:ATP-grasp domain-containing protein n=1 Tax=Dactylosporangium sp. CA-092794 TaxID=3239929 RepID=UPI003D9325CF